MTLVTSVFPPRRNYRIALPSGRELTLGDRCLVMAILNVTPDSFGDAVRFVSGGTVDVEAAVDAALRMEAAGAILTTAETAVFEWVGQSGTPEFKAISKLVQERMKVL